MESLVGRVFEALIAHLVCRKKFGCALADRQTGQDKTEKRSQTDFTQSLEGTSISMITSVAPPAGQPSGSSEWILRPCHVCMRAMMTSW